MLKNRRPLHQLAIIFTTFFVAILLTTLFSAPVQAIIPGSVNGKVEFELPDGTRVPASGSKIFRQDYWTFPYCPGNDGNNGPNSCYGYKDGVEVVVGSNGNYSMGNTGNNPGPITQCAETSGANRCPSGEKGQINYNPDPSVNCFSLNWCGFNCGSNPHRFEAYFPEGYVLPGNLAGLGYSIDRGHWITPGNGGVYDESVNNNTQVHNKNFIYKLDVAITPPLCTGVSGTMATSGTITDTTQALNFNVTSSGTVNNVSVVIHINENVDGNNWAVVGQDATPADGSYTGSVSFDQMVDLLVAKGETDANIRAKGIVWYANVSGPEYGFCAGNGIWSGTGEPCTVNQQCNGSITLATATPTPTPSVTPSPTPTPTPSVTPSPTPSPTPTPIGPMCVSIVMQSPKGAPLYTANIGDLVQFRCGEITGVTNYEFRVLAPNSRIQPLSATGRISEEYEITQSGRFYAQCRLCPTGQTCQDWEPLPIITDIEIKPNPSPKITPKETIGPVLD